MERTGVRIRGRRFGHGGLVVGGERRDKAQVCVCWRTNGRRDRRTTQKPTSEDHKNELSRLGTEVLDTSQDSQSWRQAEPREVRAPCERSQTESVSPEGGQFELGQSLVSKLCSSQRRRDRTSSVLRMLWFKSPDTVGARERERERCGTSHCRRHSPRLAQCNPTPKAAPTHPNQAKRALLNRTCGCLGGIEDADAYRCTELPFGLANTEKKEKEREKKEGRNLECSEVCTGLQLEDNGRRENQGKQREGAGRHKREQGKGKKKAPFLHRTLSKMRALHSDAGQVDVGRSRTEVSKLPSCFFAVRMKRRPGKAGA